MAGSRKVITFDFYVCEVLPLQKHQAVIGLDSQFSKIESGASPRVKSIGSTEYELRIINKADYGYRGVIGKYREGANLPHAAVPGGAERELPLKAGEKLLEKSFFKYFHENSLLIMQRNHNGVSSEFLANYLSFDGYLVKFLPIIEAADLKRLMRNEVNLCRAQVSIARPTNPEMFRGATHDFNNAIFQSLNGSKAAALNIEVRGNGKSKRPEERYLDSSIKRALVELVTKYDVNKAQIQYEEGGVRHPLDLVAERLTYQAALRVEGRYPNEADIWASIMEAKDARSPELENYFGVIGEERLI